MEIRKLDWDSEFFGLRIGRADLQTQEDAVQLATRKKELQQQFDLLYVFDLVGIGFCARDAKLVDEKVLYSKCCELRDTYQNVMLYHQSVPNESLYKLALVSGEYSRFKLDNHFPQGSYEHLYRKWIENACPMDGEKNKYVFVYAPEGRAQGMITIECNGDHAHIGLVAVDPDFQYKGFGTKIMATLETYLYHRGVAIIDVATQKNNIKACRWYEKNDFGIKSVTPIYHWWLNDF